jgi:hypothetical protein
MLISGFSMWNTGRRGIVRTSGTLSSFRGGIVRAGSAFSAISSRNVRTGSASGSVRFRVLITIVKSIACRSPWIDGDHQVLGLKIFHCFCF